MLTVPVVTGVSEEHRTKRVRTSAIGTQILIRETDSKVNEKNT